MTSTTTPTSHFTFHGMADTKLNSHRNPLLLRAIAMPDSKPYLSLRFGGGAGDAEGRADQVLPRVALADGGTVCPCTTFMSSFSDS